MGRWEGGSTKFSVKHQGKDIHHPPSFFSLVDPMPFPFPELHNIYNYSLPVLYFVCDANYRIDLAGDTQRVVMGEGPFR